MISSKILGLDIKDRLKDKYGIVVDSLSEEQRDKLGKELLDDEAIKQGAKASKKGMSAADKKIADAMRELEKLTSDGSKKTDKTKSPGPISERE